MNPFTHDDLDALLSKCETAKTCVSIYMPTIPVGDQTQQNPIRLKNRLNEAEEKLKEYGLRQPEIDEFLRPAYNLLKEADFWKHQSDGLAIFITEDSYDDFRLPLEFEDLVVVGDRFHIKPLIPMLTEDGKFFILAFSQNDVRLLQGTRHTIARVELPDMPTSLAEALRFDDPENRLQHHDVSRGRVDYPQLYHGYNPADMEHNDNIRRYMHKLNDGIMELLHGRHEPLVIAGVDYMLPIYEAANTYPHLVEDGITGSPDRVPDRELHQKGWKIVEPLFYKEMDEAKAAYKAANGVSSCDLQDILTASSGGRVMTLFIRRNQKQWGDFNVDTQKLEVYDEFQPGAQDLFDEAALQTMQTGGKVYVLDSDDMPEKNEPIAAVFRY